MFRRSWCISVFLSKSLVLRNGWHAFITVMSLALTGMGAWWQNHAWFFVVVVGQVWQTTALFQHLTLFIC